MLIAQNNQQIKLGIEVKHINSSPCFHCLVSWGGARIIVSYCEPLLSFVSSSFAFSVLVRADADMIFSFSSRFVDGTRGRLVLLVCAVVAS